MDDNVQELLIEEIKKYIADNLRLSELTDEQLEEEIENIINLKTQGKYISIEQKVNIKE